MTGRSYDHRKTWIQERLQFLSTVFAVDLCGYAVMDNHVHSILRVRPDLGAAWTEDELARRWWRLCPRRRDARGRPAPPKPDDLDRILADRAGGSERVEELRGRLTSLSWFMRFFAERIARRANREDCCKGRFWEGRFKSQRLVGENAIVACSVYVDLNPIRAGMAKTPEASSFTSGQDRLRARQATEKLELARCSGSTLPRRERERLQVCAQSARCLTPIGGEESHMTNLTLEEYLALLDHTGRRIARGKRGAIPADLAPILERLALDVEGWFEGVTSIGARFSYVIGGVAELAAEMSRTGQRWIRGASAAKAFFTNASA
jgi:REP element-mobilizing transposase RayT